MVTDRVSKVHAMTNHYSILKFHTVIMSSVSQFVAASFHIIKMSWGWETFGLYLCAVVRDSVPEMQLSVCIISFHYFFLLFLALPTWTTLNKSFVVLVFTLRKSLQAATVVVCLVTTWKNNGWCLLTRRHNFSLQKSSDHFCCYFSYLKFFVSIFWSGRMAISKVTTKQPYRKIFLCFRKCLSHQS